MSIILILTGTLIVLFVIAFHWYILVYYCKEINRPLNGKPFKYDNSDFSTTTAESKKEEPAIAEGEQHSQPHDAVKTLR